MLKPRGTDCTTAQKTCVGVPEHLRSSSSSKVDAHTTLRAISAIPLSTRHDPRFRKFDTHARTHFESTDTQHSAHCFPSAIAGRPCHHGPLQHAKRTCTGSPNMAPDTIVRIRSHTHAQHCNICKRAPAAQLCFPLPPLHPLPTPERPEQPRPPNSACCGSASCRRGASNHRVGGVLRSTPRSQRHRALTCGRQRAFQCGQEHMRGSDGV